MSLDNIPVSEESFQKNLSRFSLIMIGVGGLIGGGLFSVLGHITVIAGEFSYLSYIIMGLIALITVYSYIKLTLKWGKSCGGEYTIIKLAFKDTPKEILGGYVGLLLYFGYIGTMALYAYTFEVYFVHLFGWHNSIQILIPTLLGIMIILTYVNLKGVHQLAIFENFLVLIKISILILFILFGLSAASKNPDTFIYNVGWTQERLNDFDFGSILIGSAAIIVSYEGFQLIGNACMEMKDREKGIKTMRTTIIIAMILYCLTAIVSIGILGAEGLIGDGDADAEVAVAVAADTLMGNGGAIVMGIAALLSTASALNATLLGSSRMAFEMGYEKLLPKNLGKINPKTKVPSQAIIITAGLSLVLGLVTGGALAIAGITDLIFAQVFFIINYTNFMKRKETQSKSIWPLLGMITTFLLFIMIFVFFFHELDSYLISIIAFFVAEIATIFFLHQKRKAINKINQN